jgi:hypothetical protein
MVLKLKHELGIGNQKLLERRRVPRHPQTCGFSSYCILLLPHHVMFHSKQRNIFIFIILLDHAKGLVLQTDSIYSFTQDTSSTNY